jgi:periplasmic copper chaperone A
MNRFVRGFLVLATAAWLPIASAAAQTGQVEVTDAWARPTIGQARNGAAYMRLTNRGQSAEKLVAVSSPVAGKVELHTTVRDGEVLRMREVPSVELKPGEAVAFAPGGLHIMLVGVREPLKAGQQFPMTLRFESGAQQQVTVAVRQGAAPAQGHGEHKH